MLCARGPEPFFNLILMTLFDESSPEFNDEWIAKLAVVVDTCCGDVSVYLDERGEDSSSDSTFVSLVVYSKAVLNVSYVTCLNRRDYQPRHKM